MEMPKVSVAAEHDRTSILKTITLAFAADPIMRWAFSTADSYLTHFGRMADAYGGVSIGEGTCYRTSRAEGAALWLAPGVEPDEEKTMEIIQAGVEPERQEALGRILEEMETYHPKDNDCWYLAIIGVDPGFQGKGIGASLMKHATSILDGQSRLGYLESSNPKNISLYERHGFEIMDQIQVGDSPVVTPMIRHRR